MHFVFLYLLFTVTYCSPGLPTNDSLESRTLLTSGNYVLLYCEHNNRSAELLELLPQVWQAVQLVLQDLQYGIASRHGYRAFFKSDVHLPVLETVFKNMAAGRNVHQRHPVIDCLNPHGETPTQSSAYSRMCEQRQEHRPVRAEAWRSGFVTLCPDFWTFPAFPTSPDACPSVAGSRWRRQFAEDGSRLTDTQFSILIDAFVHLYNPLDRESDEDTASTAQECVALDTEKSIRNEGNWVFYAACKPEILMSSFGSLLRFAVCPELTDS